MKRICLVPQVSGVGGMVSFRHKFTAGLEARAIQVTNNLQDMPYDGVLVIGGTRQLAGLWRAKRQGIPVIQRLNGMNWLHRQRRTGLRHYLRSEYSNFILSFIRGHLASGIVYQSQFTQDWWERVYGPTKTAAQIIWNGVDLDVYNPTGPQQRPEGVYRLLLVEGSLAGGYEIGLETAVQLAEQLAGEHGLAVELIVVGKVSEAIKEDWEQKAKVPLKWAGLVGRDQIPQIDRSAHLLYSADINAACPNAVIEALACGLPVVAFDTGALSELVSGDAGRVVAYGADPWKLEAPDVAALTAASREVLESQGRFRAAARAHAERAFGIETMIDKYVEALQGK